MLNWTIAFFVIALAAGILGFTNIAGVAVDMAKITFVIFMVLWLISVVINILRGKGPKDPL